MWGCSLPLTHCMSRNFARGVVLRRCVAPCLAYKLVPMPVYRLITGLNVVFVVRMPPLARASSLILSACSEAVSRRNARKTDALVQPTSLTISSTVPRGQTMHLMVFFCICKELFWLMAIFFITCQVKPKMILIAWPINQVSRCKYKAFSFIFQIFFKENSRKINEILSVIF